MHVVCLGVTRKIWTKGDLKYRQSSLKIKAISENLYGCHSTYLLNLCESQGHSLNWITGKLKSFGSFSFTLVLKDILPAPLYNNFLSLSISIYLMLPPTLCTHHCGYADILIGYFLEHFRTLNGVEGMVYNVHSLCHLADDVRSSESHNTFSSK